MPWGQTMKNDNKSTIQRAILAFLFKIYFQAMGARGGAVVEVMCYKLEGHRIDS
jgi:hypothetical protein